MHTRVPGGALLVGVMLVASTGTTRAQDPVRILRLPLKLRMPSTWRR